MDKLLNAEAALLGLLAEKPMYPYQIEEVVKYRDMRFWTELSMSSIYKLLQKLEKKSLVERKNEISDKNRLRKLYNISTKGQKALAAKIKSLLIAPEHIRWQVDIGMYNLHLLPADVVINTLTDYKTGLQEKIQGYQNLLKFLKDSNCPTHRLSIAERPIFLLQAEFQWLKSFIEKFISEHSLK